MFVDSAADEVLLKILGNEAGCALVAYRLYDASGQLVADSPEPQAFPNGLLINSMNEEVLLEIPEDQEEHINYRLYSRLGQLLTISDGGRTQVFGSLRMDGKAAGPYKSREK